MISKFNKDLYIWEYINLRFTKTVLKDMYRIID